MKHVNNGIEASKLALSLCHLVPNSYRDLPQRKTSGPVDYV